MTMGDGGGHGPDTLPEPKKTIPSSFPCLEGPGGGDAARRIHVPAGHAPQVGDPSSYAVMGRVLLAAAGAFAGIFLALVFLRLYYASRRRRLHGARGGRSPRRLLRSLAIADEDGGAAPSPRGLDPAVLRALPVAAAGAGAGDCAVCLAELEPGDEARALPRCGHRFHVECIDAWFRGNATCPLCRADVVVAGEEASAPPEVRIDMPGGEAAAGKGTAAPAMGRLPSGTDLDKTRRVFASIRSASF
ncbi:hypothetical protein ACP4OV_020669 [Aristida adscensionis]